MKIHKEGYGIIRNTFLLFYLPLILLFIFFGGSVVLYTLLFILTVLFAIVVMFFRNPERVPTEDPAAIIAPADGKIVIVKEVYEGEYLKCDCIQVSIFMSVFNVHVNWFPVNGNVEYYKYHPGRYLVAMHPKSSEKNERTSIVVNTGEQKVLFRQIAGYIARRIVCYAVEGNPVQQGEQVGFIKFGSRIDLFLPLDSRIQVTKGQKVIGSETIIAKF